MNPRAHLPRLLLAAGLAAAPAATAGGDDKIAVAVMEFTSKGGIEAEKVDALSDMLANEIRGLGPYRVVGKSDIRAALALEEQKQLLGCSDESCLAELGGALGVRWVVVGNVSLFGKTYLLNLKLVDVVAIGVLAGISEKITGGEDMLIDGLSQGARRLIDEAGSKLAAAEGRPDGDPAAGEGDPAAGEGDPAGAASAALEAEAEAEAGPARPSNPRRTWGHVTFWTGTGLAAVGIIGAAVGAEAGQDYQNAELTDQERLDAKQVSRAGAGVMTAGLLLGGALMVTGVVLWAIAPSDAELAGAPAAGLAPTPDGQGLVFGLAGRW